MKIFFRLLFIISLTVLFTNNTMANPQNQDGTVLENIEHQPVISLWPEGTAGINPDISKKSKPCGKRFFDIHNPTITVYKPKKSNGVAIVLCPGGAYNYVASGVEGIPTAERLNEFGITAFVLKYRLPNTAGIDFKHPIPLSDALRSIQLVRYYAHKFNINYQKIGIMGFSAGGHLASAAGTLFTKYSFGNDDISQVSSRPDFMCLVYPVISTRKDIAHESIFSLVSDKSDTLAIANLSNDLNVTRETPPTFLVHARDDKAVAYQNSILMYEALKKHGVPCELKLYEKGGHGFGVGLSGTDSMEWITDFVSWLFRMKFIPEIEHDNVPDADHRQ